MRIYEMDLMSIVEDTEQTRFCPQMDISQYEQTHNMMQVWTGKLSELHRRTDGQGETSIPPFQLRWSGV